MADAYNFCFDFFIAVLFQQLVVKMQFSLNILKAYQQISN